TLWKKSFEDSEGHFDLIMMHHAFEHMIDPRAILKLCFEKLNPGGKLLVRTPVTDAEVWKEKRELWVQLDAPRHFIIPSVKGFTNLASEIGLELEEVEFDSSAFQFWGTALYEQGELLNQALIKTIFGSKELKEMNKKALRYNQEGKGDQACFYLVKPIKS
ncbi:MAG: putative SAM-dependent methyltransferase, partial [Algoriphagus sp.]